MIHKAHTLTQKESLFTQGYPVEIITCLEQGGWVRAQWRIYPEEMITHWEGGEGIQSWEVSWDSIPNLRRKYYSQSCWSEKTTQTGFSSRSPFIAWSDLSVVVDGHGPEASLGLGASIGWGPCLLTGIQPLLPSHLGEWYVWIPCPRIVGCDGQGWPRCEPQWGTKGAKKPPTVMKSHLIGVYGNATKVSWV